jgi:hypothetical protein
MSVGRLRSNSGYYGAGCNDIGASLARTADVLGWFGSGVSCKLPVNISGVPGDGTPTEVPVVTVASLGPAWPNPMSAGTRITLTQGSAGGAVRLEIFDVTGRMVRRLVDGPLPVGPHELAWDGRAADGSRVVDGMYFYRLSTADGVQAKKLVVIRGR